MPSWQEALAAIQGLKRLLRFDAGFSGWFDLSSRGALRSFGLMIPVLPCVLVLLFSGKTLQPELGGIHLAGTIATYYVLSWIMFPLSLVALGRLLDREIQAIGAITFYNWFGSILVLVALPLHLLGWIAGMESIASFAVFFLIIASLVLETFAYRVLLGIGYLGAALLTVFDYVLSQSLFVLLVSDLFLRPPGL